MKLPAYLCPRRVACASPSGGSLHGTVWAFSWKPSAAVRVAEALTVLFADLCEQTVECLHKMLTLHMTWPRSWSELCLFFISGCTAQFSTSVQKFGLHNLNSKAFHLKWNLTHCGYCGWQYTYFLLEKAMEDEDKHSLKRVEYGEEVCHDNRGLIDEEETKGPRQTQKTQQSEGTHDPGSEGQQTQRERTNPAWEAFSDRIMITKTI